MEELNPKIITDAESFALNNAIVIKDNSSLATAAEAAKQVKSKYKEVEGIRMSMTKPLDESKKKIMEFFRKPLDLLDACEVNLKKQIIEYKQEQDRITNELNEKFRKIAEQEELKRKEELIATANLAQGCGSTDIARELLEQAQLVSIPAPVAHNFLVKPEGLSTRKTWKFHIVNLGLIPREFLIPDEKRLQSIATNMKEGAVVEGVEFYCEESISIRI